MAAEDTKDRRHAQNPAAEAHRKAGSKAPSADSVDRTPSGEPTKQDVDDRVSHEDEPRGHPTSDRFRTEQAHRKSAPDA